MAREIYLAQVRLLMRLLPLLADEPSFALKGGTAINLFHRDMPRLSVDIDLAYLPIADRTTSLNAINEAFGRLTARIDRMPGATAKRIAGGGDTRLLAAAGSATVKIETSPVMRGVIGEPYLMRAAAAVENEFGFAAVKVVSFEDLFAGKIHAALDRQHPRDLFDVMLLYDDEGLTDDLFRVFLVYAACSNRPLHELLAPNEKDIAEDFTREFAGMTAKPVELEDLVSARLRLINDIKARLHGRAADFLIGLQSGVPDFTLIDLPQAADLPAIRWKILNLKKLIASNPDKHRAQTDALQNALRT